MDALKENEYREIQKELDECKNPLFFFHDDPDGLCSFLLLYRYKKEGNGIIVKSNPIIDEKFIKKVNEYRPDKIFVLDIADISEEFIDKINIPIIWIDHHGPYKREKVKYFNPRVHDTKNNPPVSYICYFVVDQDEWISLCGMVGDWFLPKKEIIDKYFSNCAELLPQDVTKPDEALFNSKIGFISKIFSFVLKGNYKDAMKYVKIISRLKNYNEILNQETPQGKYIYKKYEKINKDYIELLNIAKKNIQEKIILFTYSQDKMSFTGDIANELLYLYPDKIIIIARQKNNEMKCSMRSSKINLPKLIEKCMVGLDGYGGGHENAAGVVIKKSDFNSFIEKINNEI
ncbi:MAG: DHHA1 domain-containing protein [Nanoarchaeota archaeon]